MKKQLLLVIIIMMFSLTSCVFFHFENEDEETIMQNFNIAHVTFDSQDDRYDIYINEEYIYIDNSFTSYFIDRLNESTYLLDKDNFKKIRVYNEINTEYVINLLEIFFLEHLKVKNIEFKLQVKQMDINGFTCDVYVNTINHEESKIYYYVSEEGFLVKSEYIYNYDESFVDKELLVYNTDEDDINQKLSTYLQYETTYVNTTYDTWPEVLLLKDLPKYSDGEFVECIDNVITSKIIITNTTLNNVSKYLNKLSKKDYQITTYETTEESIKAYGYLNNIFIDVQYENETLTIDLKFIDVNNLEQIIEGYPHA